MRNSSRLQITRSNKMADIPGYYYDKQKRRYFRSPPDHVAYMSDHLQPPSAPPRHTSTPSSPPVSLPHDPAKRHHPSLPSREQTPLLSLLSPLQHSHDPLLSLTCHTLPRTLVLSCRRKRRIISSSSLGRSGGPDTETHGRMKDIIVSAHGNLLAYVKSIESTFPLDRLFISEVQPSRRKKKVTVKEVCQYEVASCPGRVVDIASCGDGHLALFSCPSPPSQLSLLSAARLEGGRVHRVSVTGLPLREGGTLCSALSCGDGELMAATGVSRGYVQLLRLLESGDKLTFLTQRRTPDRSAILSVTFAPQSSLLFAGTRSGKVMVWDLRANPIAYLTSNYYSISSAPGVKPSVIQLHAFRDDNYFIANCMASMLVLWDCRMRRSLLSYPSHVNQYFQCRSVVDCSENFIAAVGEDQIIRIWSLWRGRLLRSIPATEYIHSERLSRGELPAISYSDCLGGPRGYPALLIGSHDGITAMSL